VRKSWTAVCAALALGPVPALGLAACGPAGASGSQFFIVTTGNAALRPDYALLGKVFSGLGVVQAIGSLPTTPPVDGMPTPTVVMSSVRVATSR
jgi:cyclophilin family peptidyl-prolyl cis-trans isomerase